jgi:hypothetical protein
MEPVANSIAETVKTTKPSPCCKFAKRRPCHDQKHAGRRFSLLQAAWLTGILLVVLSSAAEAQQAAQPVCRVLLRSSR